MHCPTPGILCLLLSLAATARAADVRFPAVLPKTKPLTIQQPLHEVMVAGINRFAERELQLSVARRRKLWNRDYRNRKAYETSITENRERLKTYLGVVDPRVKSPRFELLATYGRGSDAGGSGPDHYTVSYIRWRVMRGVTAEGLFVQPQGMPAKARVIALSDADWTPEQFCGLDRPKKDVPWRIVALLARHGCEVVIPTLISRDDTFSGHPDVGYTNQPHREFIYRMAFEMGRHIIGYEVQKTLAAVDAFTQLNHDQNRELPIGVVGVGEGGLLALFSAAVDPRISATMVCGYFQNREHVWREPIYRNVWAQLTEFGDADLAGMITPRTLVIEACAVPTVSGPPKPRPGRRGGAAPGRIEVPALSSVKFEFQRARIHFEKLKAANRITLAASQDGNGLAGTAAGLAAFLKGLNVTPHALAATPATPVPVKSPGGDLRNPAKRQERQFRELVNFTQNLLRHSARVRDKYWSDAKRSSLADWRKTSRKYRKAVWEDMIGRLPDPTMPPNVRTRRLPQLDKPKYVGYEVVIDVYPDVIAGGHSAAAEGPEARRETRPVVVCQHGLEGVPMDTITADPKSRA